MRHINEILQCPACQGNIDQGLRCIDCRSQYHERQGVPVIISSSVTKCRSCWDSVDFASGRIESKISIYRRFLNAETIEAQALWRKAMTERIGRMGGLTADVATGLWGLAQDMLECNHGMVTVSIEIDAGLLKWKNAQLKAPPGCEHHSVASDVLHFAFADNTFDGIANADSLINLSEAEIFLAEMHRTLKPGGRLVAMHRMFGPESRSWRLARVYGIHRTLEPGSLMELLEGAGFRKAKVEEVSRAVWAENPGQVFPVPGDLQTFAIVEAVK